MKSDYKKESFPPISLPLQKTVKKCIFIPKKWWNKIFKIFLFVEGENDNS